MRREGYEFAVSKPEVLYKIDERGKKLEPMEIAYIDVPEEFSGTVIQMLSERKGELQGMSTASDGSVRLEFHIPSRGLIGFRGNFLTSTKGTGIINTIFDGYSPYKGDFQYRKQGSLIAFEGGEAVTYGLFAAQERGTLFIGPGEKVYSGMVIGQRGKSVWSRLLSLSIQMSFWRLLQAAFVSVRRFWIPVIVRELLLRKMRKGL